jgi:hypothetical protein
MYHGERWKSFNMSVEWNPSAMVRMEMFSMICFGGIDHIVAASGCCSAWKTCLSLARPNPLVQPPLLITDTHDQITVPEDVAEPVPPQPHSYTLVHTWPSIACHTSRLSDHIESAVIPPHDFQDHSPRPPIESGMSLPRQARPSEGTQTHIPRGPVKRVQGEREPQANKGCETEYDPEERWTGTSAPRRKRKKLGHPIELNMTNALVF